MLKKTFIYPSQRPVVAAGVFIAPNASVIGKVLLFNDVSVSCKIFGVNDMLFNCMIFVRFGTELFCEAIKARLKLV